MPTLTKSQVSLLQRLRGVFLSEAMKGDYWDSEETLEAYDKFLAARIGWKWDAVLRELRAKHSLPGSLFVWDWGCGTGIASRRFLHHFPETKTVYLSDRSERAIAFAKRKLASLPIAVSVRPPNEPYFLLLSHVLNELSEKQELEISKAIHGSVGFAWVEPGTKTHSDRLIRQREKLSEQFHWVAPCPHNQSCGLLTPENARHWCHHFAEPPPEVFQSGEWADFHRLLQVDLRSLPVSYLVGTKEARPNEIPNRVIGQPRELKGHVKALVCSPEGVSEKTVLERKAPELFERLTQRKFVHQFG